MSKVCMITGARSRAGNSRSHSNRATNRWFKPNIIEKKLDLGNGLKVKIKMTARAYKKIKKNGGVQSLLVG